MDIIDRLENYIKYTNNRKPVICFLYRVLLYSIIYKDYKYIDRAIEYNKKLYIKDKFDMENIYIYILFLNLLERYDKSKNILDSIQGYYKYCKKKDELNYGIINFLKCINDFYMGNHNSVHKYYNKISRNNSTTLLLLAILNYEIYEDYDKAVYLLMRSYKLGSKNPFLYLYVHKIYTKNKFFNNIDIIYKTYSFIYKYSIKNKDMTILISNNILENSSISRLKFNIVNNIYKEYGDDLSFHALVYSYVKSKATSKTALEIYIKAYNKNIFIKDMEYVFIKASVKNNYKNIPSIFIQKYIDNTKEDDELAYILSLICADKKYNFLKNKNKDKLYYYSQYFYYNNKVGYNYYNIYKETYKHNKFIDMEKVYMNHLFLYEIYIYNSDIIKIFIIQKEKENVDVYTVDNNRIIITSVYNDFSIYGVDKNNEYYNEKWFDIINVIDYIDIARVIKYYNIHRLSIYGLFIARYYMEKYKYDNIIEDIYKYCLNYSDINGVFRKDIYIKLAMIYYNKGDYNNASMYFDCLDLEYIDEDILEYIVSTYKKLGDYKKIMDIILETKDYVKSETILENIKYDYLYELYNEYDITKNNGYILN